MPPALCLCYLSPDGLPEGPSKYKIHPVLVPTFIPSFKLQAGGFLLLDVASHSKSVFPAAQQVPAACPSPSEMRLLWPAGP